VAILRVLEQDQKLSPFMKRRTFAINTALAALSPLALRSEPETKMHIATNTYPWGTFAKRENKPFALHSDEALAMIASCGIPGYEPAINNVSEFDGLGARLKAHGMEMRSLYVNSFLHDEAQAAQSIESVLSIARKAAEIGTRIIVTNPSPIKWGGPENKTDANLITQAESLDKLGAELNKLGLTLAYHNHDIELRNGAREFHHMLTGTNPEHVKFCLDVHWVYRGCGNSQVALFDTLELYGNRVVELHLRQSKDGIWTEVFTATGDIDYARVASWLQQHKVKPLLTLEQAVEGGSPNTMIGVEAHQQSVQTVRKVFASLA